MAALAPRESCALKTGSAARPAVYSSDVAAARENYSWLSETRGEILPFDPADSSKSDRKGRRSRRWKPAIASPAAHMTMRNRDRRTQTIARLCRTRLSYIVQSRRRGRRETTKPNRERSRRAGRKVANSSARPALPLARRAGRQPCHGPGIGVRQFHDRPGHSAGPCVDSDFRGSRSASEVQGEFHSGRIHISGRRER